MNQTLSLPKGVEIKGTADKHAEVVLTPEAIQFLAKLSRQFDDTRRKLLARRVERQKEIDAGVMPDFLSSTKRVRDGEWKVASIPADLQDRRTEITGPLDRKMIINALNSGAKVFMADCEDATAPTWSNMVEGQLNLFEAVRRTIGFKSPEGREYRLADKTAVLFVRPRGWHLLEKHMLVDGEPVSGGLFDCLLYLF